MMEVDANASGCDRQWHVSGRLDGGARDGSFRHCQVFHVEFSTANCIEVPMTLHKC